MASLIMLHAAAAQQPAQRQPDLDANRLEASYNSGKALVRDAALDAYLGRIVERIVSTDAIAGTVPVRIHALHEALPYAFALENGALYVSTGLIARLANESQLAGLIAGEIAALARHDDQNSRESSRQRATRRAVPDFLLLAVTAGLAAKTLVDKDAEAARNLDAQLRLESDRLALHWLQAAGYRASEVPLGLQRVLDSLTAEEVFGTSELASSAGLNARIDSFRRAMPAGQAEVASVAPSAPDEFAPLARRFSLELVREDLDRANHARVIALLDRVEAESGVNGESACLRAEFIRRSLTDLTRLPDAIRAFEACTDFSDAPATAFRELAFLYRRQGETASARLNFERYLERAPGAVDAPIVRGYLEGN